jgi:hypothetical protein
MSGSLRREPPVRLIQRSVGEAVLITSSTGIGAVLNNARERTIY